MDDFTKLAAALEASMKQEQLLTQIHTLAIEYQAKNISGSRFADRVVELLVSAQKDRNAASNRAT